MKILSTADVGELFSNPTWRIRRLYEDGTLPEPPRFAGKRAIPSTSLPEIAEALRARGWLPEGEPVLAAEERLCK